MTVNLFFVDKAVNDNINDILFFKCLAIFKSSAKSYITKNSLYQRLPIFKRQSL